ncbi:MAG: hypothetical protein EZS28_034008, partial [Streblomastix strix]
NADASLFTQTSQPFDPFTPFYPTQSALISSKQPDQPVQSLFGQKPTSPSITPQLQQGPTSMSVFNSSPQSSSSPQQTLLTPPSSNPIFFGQIPSVFKSSHLGININEQSPVTQFTPDRIKTDEESVKKYKLFAQSFFRWLSMPVRYEDVRAAEEIEKYARETIRYISALQSNENEKDQENESQIKNTTQWYGKDWSSLINNMLYQHITQLPSLIKTVLTQPKQLTKKEETNNLQERKDDLLPISSVLQQKPNQIQSIQLSSFNQLIQCETSLKVLGLELGEQLDIGTKVINLSNGKHGVIIENTLQSPFVSVIYNEGNINIGNREQILSGNSSSSPTATAQQVPTGCLIIDSDIKQDEIQYNIWYLWKKEQIIGAFSAISSIFHIYKSLFSSLGISEKQSQSSSTSQVPQQLPFDDKALLGTCMFVSRIHADALNLLVYIPLEEIYSRIQISNQDQGLNQLEIKGEDIKQQIKQPEQLMQGILEKIIKLVLKKRVKEFEDIKMNRINALLSELNQIEDLTEEKSDLNEEENVEQIKIEDKKDKIDEEKEKEKTEIIKSENLLTKTLSLKGTKILLDDKFISKWEESFFTDVIPLCLVYCKCCLCVTLLKCSCGELVHFRQQIKKKEIQCFKCNQKVNADDVSIQCNCLDPSMRSGYGRSGVMKLGSETQTKIVFFTLICKSEMKKLAEILNQRNKDVLVPLLHCQQTSVIRVALHGNNLLEVDIKTGRLNSIFSGLSNIDTKQIKHPKLPIDPQQLYEMPFEEKIKKKKKKEKEEIADKSTFILQPDQSISQMVADPKECHWDIIPCFFAKDSEIIELFKEVPPLKQWKKLGENYLWENIENYSRQILLDEKKLQQPDISVDPLLVSSVNQSSSSSSQSESSSNFNSKEDQLDLNKHIL